LAVGKGAAGSITLVFVLCTNYTWTSACKQIDMATMYRCYVLSEKILVSIYGTEDTCHKVHHHYFSITAYRFGVI